MKLEKYTLYSFETEEVDYGHQFIYFFKDMGEYVSGNNIFNFYGIYFFGNEHGIVDFDLGRHTIEKWSIFDKYKIQKISKLVVDKYVLHNIIKRIMK